MSNILDSPILKALSTTNSLFLGAGALYLSVFGDEKLQYSSAKGRAKPVAVLKPRFVEVGQESKKSAKQRPETKDLEEFAHSLREWNENLSVLEDHLAKRFPDTDSSKAVQGVDEVDAVEFSGYNNSAVIFETLDQTLNDVVEKVSHLRHLLRTKHRKDRTKEVIHHQCFASSELPLFNDDDSDADSFLSAESEAEGQDDVAPTGINKAKLRALEIAGIHRDKALYVKGLEQYFHHGVKCRKRRSEMVGVSSDVEFMAKIHCIREASKVSFSNKDIEKKFEKSAADLLDFLIKTAGKDHHECQKRWKALVSFCQSPENWKVMESELGERGVPFITFYDVVLDFIVMDAFADLENPPYSVQAAVQNAWLPTYIQQTGLETAVWGVLKAKMQMLQEPAGFLVHFYHLSEILTPVLAWGFLGSDDKLTKACNIFKEQLMGYIQDLFNFQSCDYASVESLAKDISRLAEERYENLKPLLSDSH